MSPKTALKRRQYATTDGTITAEVRDVSALPARGRAACQGYVSSITIAPPQAKPEFVAIVKGNDREAFKAAKGEGRAPKLRRVRLVWLGQRHVPGVDAGIKLRFEGMVSLRDGLPTIFNPRYEILGRPETAPEPVKRSRWSRKANHEHS